MTKAKPKKKETVAELVLDDHLDVLEQLLTKVQEIEENMTLNHFFMKRLIKHSLNIMKNMVRKNNKLFINQNLHQVINFHGCLTF